LLLKKEYFIFYILQATYNDISGSPGRLRSMQLPCYSSVVRTPTRIPNNLVVTVGGEHFRSPVGCNHCDVPEMPNLSPILDQPSSPSHSLPPLYNDAGDANFIGVDNAVVNESMTNLDQVRHTPRCRRCICRFWCFCT
jgi:hypothetical protein